MRGLAEEGSRDLTVRNKAVKLTSGLPHKDYAGEACACLAYARDEIRYVKDPASAEMISPPAWVMDIGAGDCDDKAVLLGGLLGSLGHQARFIAVAFAPEQYTHVWVQDFLYGRWIDLEPTEPVGCGERIPGDGAWRYLVSGEI
jgi:transglutaminase-like putative cysteine protease